MKNNKTKPLAIERIENIGKAIKKLPRHFQSGNTTPDPGTSTPLKNPSGQGHTSKTPPGIPGGKIGSRAISPDNEEKQQMITKLFQYIASSSGPQDSSHIAEMIEKIIAMEVNETEGTPNENPHAENFFPDETQSNPAGNNSRAAGGINIIVKNCFANEVQNYFNGGSDDDPTTDRDFKDEFAGLLETALQGSVDEVSQGI